VTKKEKERGNLTVMATKQVVKFHRLLRQGHIFVHTSNFSSLEGTVILQERTYINPRRKEFQSLFKAKPLPRISITPTSLLSSHNSIVYFMKIN